MKRKTETLSKSWKFYLEKQNCHGNCLKFIEFPRFLKAMQHKTKNSEDDKTEEFWK